MRHSVIILCLLGLTVTQEVIETGTEEPICETASADRINTSPQCDPCSAQVYQEHNDPRSIKMFEKVTSAHCERTLKGWTRFMQGTGKLSEKCTMQNTCGSTNTNWMNGVHPSEDEGIVEREMCAHRTKGSCCTDKKPFQVKNCGAYFVYFLPDPFGNCNNAYCVVPKVDEIPDVCNDPKFIMTTDERIRSELAVTHTTSTEITTGNDDEWYAFKDGSGMIKQTCPGYYHCNTRYPSWIIGDYPENEGEITHVMSQSANNEYCTVSHSAPMYIVKCGDKYYHKLVSSVLTYASYCIKEDTKHLCERAETLSEEWRGTQQHLERAQCDTNSLDFEDWYRFSQYNKRMPNQCVSEERCGTTKAFWMIGEHPKPHEGVVGRAMSYSSKTNCRASSKLVWVLNCGDNEGDDFIYHFEKPAGCDQGVCVEEEPCDSYTELSEPERGARTPWAKGNLDIDMQHGWYRFMNDKGYMPQSPIIAGHSGVAAYPGWYKGEMPMSDRESKTGETCFVHNANTCQKSLPTTVKHCGDYYVYHLQNPASTYGYTVEQEVCNQPTMKLDGDERQQWVEVSRDDNGMTTGWYQFTSGSQMMPESPGIKGYGAVYPGWMKGEHPTEEDGIVERTVVFVTSETAYESNAKKIWVRNCGGHFMYYLISPGSNYGYTVAQSICTSDVTVNVINDPSRLYTNLDDSSTTRKDGDVFNTQGIYRFTAGKGRLVEEPRIQGFFHGGFQRNYYFPAGSHASVADQEISDVIKLPQFHDANTNRRYEGWPWYMRIARCGGHYLYIINSLTTSYTASGIVVDADEQNICNGVGEHRWFEENNSKRLVTSIGTEASSDNTLVTAWYRFTAGLGYMPTQKFGGYQCTVQYHGILSNPHPAVEDGIQENNVCFTGTTTSCQANKRTWVLNCGGFYLYRLSKVPGTNYGYCEMASGCKNHRVLTDNWRINGQKVATSKHEKTHFGADGWVKFDIGQKKIPETVSPLHMGGCQYSGYIDSHPKIGEGVVNRELKFQNDETQNIQVEYCGNDIGYLYFLSGANTANNYCFVADSDVCQEDVYTEMNDYRRLRYTWTDEDTVTLDNNFEGWYRFTGGLGKLMNEPPALEKSCSAQYQGWVNGTNPRPGDGVVTRQLCWKKDDAETCFQSNDINIKSCSNAQGEQYLVYGIVKKAASTKYGHCVDQDRTDVCEDAEILDDPARGMLTPTTKLLNDHEYFKEFKYYRFTNGLGRIVNYPVKGSYCGSNNYKKLMHSILKTDENTGDFLYKAGTYSTGWTGHYKNFIAMQCDGYLAYGLREWKVYKAGYCIEEDICTAKTHKSINDPTNLQYNDKASGSVAHGLAPGWYKVTIGNKKLATVPSDLKDCGAAYPGFVFGTEPTFEEGIKEMKMCYRTSATAAPSTCTTIYQKKCPTGMLYYLDSIQTSGSYSICIETDVCQQVTPKDLNDSWRMSGNPSVGSGDDNFGPEGWWRVNIGLNRFAENREEANCGSTYGGWLESGRHPTKAEGTLQTKICYDPNHETSGVLTPRNCYDAQVVNCGNYYMYKMSKTPASYGVCIATGTWPMCTNYHVLDDDWRVIDVKTVGTARSDSTELAATMDGWYRFEVGNGRLTTTAPHENGYGGGTYPGWAKDLVMPGVDDGIRKFNMVNRYTDGNREYWARPSWVKMCPGGFPVYYLQPGKNPTAGTFTVESDYCKDDTYTVIDEVRRLSWSSTDESVLDANNDNADLPEGWYRFKGGNNNQINEQCVPQYHGGTRYPGWMEGGHPEVDGQVVTRTVYYRRGASCTQANNKIKVKKCGGFYVYFLTKTPTTYYSYTISSDPCKVETNTMDEEDRSIFNKDQTDANDNSLPEGWYKITTGNKVLAKKSPAKYSCKTQYPSWMNGADPTVDEGVVTRELCSYRHQSGDPTLPAANCYWKKEIKARNCGTHMLYYFKDIQSGTRTCVEHTLKQTCDSAVLLDDDWRGSAYQWKRGQVTRDDKDLPHGWYKFGAHSGKLANFPVSTQYCGSTQPLHMEGAHNMVKGTCETKQLWMTHTRIQPEGRSGEIEECLCENGEYIYYHTHKAWISASYKSTFCEEMDPCNNNERIYSSYRSAWNPTSVAADPSDSAMEPNWVTLQYGSRKMPTFAPELQSCGRKNPGWYDGEMPVMAGEEKYGQTCFVTSATALCSNPRRTQVRKCGNGKLIYHWLPTASTAYGYCIDQDVCGVPAERWDYKSHSSRLRWTSVSGYKTPVNDNSIPKKNWYTMTAGLKKMPEECVGYQSCGAQYPGWLNGVHPTRDEGLVEREVCFRDATDCCKFSQKIKVIQCKSGYMYRLQPTTSSNRRYCIDESPDDVCKNDVPEFQDPRHGIGHYKDSTFLSDYLQYLQPSWFKVGVHQNVLLHYPPPMYQCGTTYPGWVKDPMPEITDGVVDSYSCFRESMANEDCKSATPLKMRNCNGEMRYMYVPPTAATRNMCVEEDICAAENHAIFDGEDWRLAYTARNDDTTSHHTDVKKLPDAPHRGWFRFTNTGLNRVVETQQEYRSCGTNYPAWLDGKHPTTEEGVVTRTLRLTNDKNYKWGSLDILIKNCNGFMVYSMNMENYKASDSTKWALCIDTDVCDAPVTQLSQPSRLLNVWGHLLASDDTKLARGWYRFENGYEQMPESCPADHACGSKEPGWLSQLHPTEEEGLAERKVCFANAGSCCQHSTDIMVKNCGTHYVYRLYEQPANKKYCVDESANSMCQNYIDINDDWRGENVAWNSSDSHGDGSLEHGWYRFSNELGHMPEYCMSWHGCGAKYPGYLKGGVHPTKEQGIQEDEVCFSTSNTNCGQSCKKIRVRNCGKFYVYELVPTASADYGYCVAQDQCDKAIELKERWRLVLNPSLNGAKTDNSMRKGWYRMVEGSGRFANYEPENHYGGGVYPGYVLDPLPTVKDGTVDAIVKYAGATTTTDIKVKNCSEHIIYWLQPTPGTQYTMSIDQDICLHAKPLDEEWRSMFNIVEDDERNTDFGIGQDWYQFTTGFKQMAEDSPSEPNACGTQYAGYLRERHPRIDEGILTREVCFRDDRQWWSNNCFKKEDVKVKNCGDMYAYQLDPEVAGSAYCAYNRKSNCVPKVIHAKYGSAALINCSLSTDDRFDAEEVQWTKLSDTVMPAALLNNMVISDDNMLVNINNMADKNAGVYGMYIPSTDTSEMVEVILYNAVETEKKYYYADLGADVEMNVVINVEPAPAAGKISWTKSGKAVNGARFVLSEENRRLTIKGLTKGDTGTYTCTAEFSVDGVDYTKSSTMIVKEEEEEIKFAK